MTRILALATAATLSLGTAVQAQDSLDMGFNMLTGAVFNALQSRGISTANINNLSLSQLAQIRAILSSDDSEGQKTQRIQQIVGG